MSSAETTPSGLPHTVVCDRGVALGVPHQRGAAGSIRRRLSGALREPVLVMSGMMGANYTQGVAMGLFRAMTKGSAISMFVPASDASRASSDARRNLREAEKQTDLLREQARLMRGAQPMPAATHAKILAASAELNGAAPAQQPTDAFRPTAEVARAAPVTRREKKAAAAASAYLKKHPAPAAPVVQAPPPGWYTDLQDAKMSRWFDGAQWTEFTQPR